MPALRSPRQDEARTDRRKLGRRLGHTPTCVLAACPS